MEDANQHRAAASSVKLIITDDSCNSLVSSGLACFCPTSNFTTSIAFTIWSDCENYHKTSIASLQ